MFSHNLLQGTVHAEDESTATLLGMRTRAYKFQPVADIKNITNFELRCPCPLPSPIHINLLVTND